MGIAGMVRRRMAQAKSIIHKSPKEQAAQLQEMRKKRIKLEGEAALSKLRQQEREKMEAAKQQLSEKRKEKFKKFAKGLKEFKKSRKGKGISVGLQNTMGKSKGPEFGLANKSAFDIKGKGPKFGL